MDDECFSRFFQDDNMQSQSKDKSPLLSPNASNNSNSSQEISQVSVDSETDISLSQLTIQEEELLNISPFYNITPRIMPMSPHNIIEEQFSANPWAMLIATVFLTKTSAKNAKPYMKEFFEEYPTPYHVLSENPSVLERFFEKLGLKKRGGIIWKLTYQYISSKWRRASDLIGIGKYGEDAYRIFCLGHTDLDPGDRYLKLYIDWLRCQTGFLQDNGVIDSEYVIEDPVLKYYRITLRDAD